VSSEIVLVAVAVVSVEKGIACILMGLHETTRRPPQGLVDPELVPYG
jgi:hypothetical protein